MATKYYKAHEVDKGDPKIHGPYLDDIRAQQERARREAKMKNKPKGRDPVRDADAEYRAVASEDKQRPVDYEGFRKDDKKRKKTIEAMARVANAPKKKAAKKAGKN